MNLTKRTNQNLHDGDSERYSEPAGTAVAVGGVSCSVVSNSLQPHGL